MFKEVGYDNITYLYDVRPTPETGLSVIHERVMAALYARHAPRA